MFVAIKKKKTNLKKFSEIRELREKDLKNYLKQYKVSKDDLEEILGILTNAQIELYKCMLDSLVLQDILLDLGIEIDVVDYAERIKKKAKKIPYEKTSKKKGKK